MDSREKSVCKSGKTDGVRVADGGEKWKMRAGFLTLVSVGVFGDEVSIEWVE